MAENKRYLDLNGLSYTIRKLDNKKANVESPNFLGTPTAPTANKGTKDNTIASTKFVQNAVDDYVLKAGDTMTGQLKFIVSKLPILDLQMSKSASNAYTLTTNGSLFIGDATSINGARVYYCRKVNNLQAAILASVSVGYNPLDNAIWQTTKDYGIKFDVNVATDTTPQPSAIRQSASFYVGVNGAVVGYSGSASKAIDKDCIYKVLDSNNISQNEYIKALENRIAVLEEKIKSMEAESNV